MRYQKDEDVIEKLWLNANGKYPRMTQGDVEYIIMAIERCAAMENYLQSSGILKTFEEYYTKGRVK